MKEYYKDLEELLENIHIKEKNKEEIIREYKERTPKNSLLFSFFYTDLLFKAFTYYKINRIEKHLE